MYYENLNRKSQPFTLNSSQENYIFLSADISIDQQSGRLTDRHTKRCTNGHRADKKTNSLLDL